MAGEHLKLLHTWPQELSCLFTPALIPYTCICQFLVLFLDHIQIYLVITPGSTLRNAEIKPQSVMCKASTLTGFTYLSLLSLNPFLCQFEGGKLYHCLNLSPPWNWELKKSAFFVHVLTIEILFVLHVIVIMHYSSKTYGVLFSKITYMFFAGLLVIRALKWSILTNTDSWKHRNLTCMASRIHTGHQVNSSFKYRSWAGYESFQGKQ